MSQAPFATDNYDLALTMVGEGFDVRYTGPHQGVFRFESVKLAALMTLPPEKRPPLPPALFCDGRAYGEAPPPAVTSREPVAQRDIKSVR